MERKFNKENITTTKSLEFKILRDYQKEIEKAQELVEIMKERYDLMDIQIRTEQPIPNHILRKYE